MWMSTRFLPTASSMCSAVAVYPAPAAVVPLHELVFLPPATKRPPIGQAPFQSQNGGQSSLAPPLSINPRASQRGLRGSVEYSQSNRNSVSGFALANLDDSFVWEMRL